MPTRFYFPALTEAPVSPAFGGWGETDGALRRKMVTTKGTSAISEGTSHSWTAGQTQLDRQYVSDPIAAQTISGTAKGQLMCREFDAADNASFRLRLFVVSADGSVERGTLLALGSYVGTEFDPSNITNRKLADGDALSSVAALSGDRIVLEIGFGDAAGTTPGAQCRYGEDAADLPEDETQTTIGAGWFELSGTIVLQGLAGTVAAAASVSGAIKVAQKLAGTIAAAATLTGILRATLKLTGTIAAQSNLTGGLNPEPAKLPEIVRWLVHIEHAGTEYRLATKAGDVGGYRWHAGLLSAAPVPSALDVENITLSDPSASLVFSREALGRFLDPLGELLSAARYSVYGFDGATLWKYVEGEPRVPSDIRIGDVGGIVTVRVVESPEKNPLFPDDTIAADDDFSSAVLEEDAEGQAWSIAYGDAFDVKAVRLREQFPYTQYLFTSLPLATDPHPYATMPSPLYPGVSDLVPNTLTTLKYGLNSLVRDDFLDGTIGKGWLQASGSFTEAVGGPLSSGAVGDHRLIWNAWPMRDLLSVRFGFRPTNNPVVGGPWLIWNWIDVNNHARLQFDLPGNTVKLIVVEGGTQIVNESLPITLDATLNAWHDYFFDLAPGQVSVGVDSKRVQFSGVSSASIAGKFGIGVRDGAGDFRQQTMPSPYKSGSTSIVSRIRYALSDKNMPYVNERYRGELSADLFASFHEARGIDNAGDMVDDILRRFGGYLASQFDEVSWTYALTLLRRWPVGAAFTQQQAIFSVIRDRLGPQFFFAVAKSAGKLIAVALDPTVPPVASLEYGRELVDLGGEVQEATAFTKFKVRYKFSAASQKWKKKEKLVLTSPEPRNFPTQDLRDVVHRSAAQRWVATAAAFYGGGKTVPYIQRAEWLARLPVGTPVLLTDTQRKFSNTPAIMVKPEPLEPNWTRFHYRTYTPFGFVPQSPGAVAED